MDDCIFCKIVKGEIPSSRIYEDNDVVVLLDISPFSKGHILVIPKEHYRDLLEIPDELLAKLSIVTKKITKLLQEKISHQGFTIRKKNGEKAGQTVQHVHIHIKGVYEDTVVQSEEGIRQSVTKEELEELERFLILRVEEK